MIVDYDLHIHSALSPCADDDMTPANICGFASLAGLDMIAVADHNAIGNVEAALSAGKEYGVTVIPALELQTSEDIHVLCLFETFRNLKDFFDTLSFIERENRPDIFGNQLLFDEDDNLIGKENRLLAAGAKIGIEEVKARVEMFGGAAVPAHIDREANGVLAILGAVPEEFEAVELSKAAPLSYRELYGERFRLITDSDAHTLNDIGGGSVELYECSAKAMLDYLNGK